MTTQSNNLSVVMLGASGAVGTETLSKLMENGHLEKLTLLGRNPIANIEAEYVKQHKISIFDTNSYQEFLPGHSTAICTLGVGEPSKMEKEEFIKIDKTAVLDFAKECKKAGVTQFELLASIGINPSSSSLYLRTKGELVEELKLLKFDRLSIFEPSIILTPTNRFGFTQGIMLKVFPILKPLLFGSLRKYRGVPVNILGEALAKNIFIDKKGYETLRWDEFYTIIENKK